MMFDYFLKDCRSLLEKDLFLFDMDGTLYNDDFLFVGSKELLNYLKENNKKYYFITNNSSKSADAYVKKLGKMGIEAKENEVFSSIDASILLLKEKFPNKLVYVQGTNSFIEQLKSSGIRVCVEVRNDIDVVLTGYDTELNYEKLKKTCEILSKYDVAYYATNPDFVCPCEFGFVPDNGAVAIMIELATKKRPIYIGKPEPTMINILCDRNNIEKNRAVVVGDRLYTDIASGNNAGVTTICVLSGEAKIEDINNSADKPTFVFESVKEIYDLLNMNQ